jgi:ABC-2 type transport system ATP-binding protein
MQPGPISVMVEGCSSPNTDRMPDIIRISELSKTYESGFHALKNVSLNVRRGEILALLGPNGAGKTTLISIVCGIVTSTHGHVSVDGHDTVKDYRASRAIIGLVPQELTTDAFETVWNSVSFSRGLFGKAPNPALIERILKDLSLWDKRDNKIMTLSGGMKRRLLIAKALSHEPTVLFLDEPTAGVDVNLRRDMWALVSKLQQTGVTIILTTHYIEEAQEMADRIAVINKGEIVLVEDKVELMRKLGKKHLKLQLARPLASLPASLQHLALTRSNDGLELVCTYDVGNDSFSVPDLLTALAAEGIDFTDIQTAQSSLEDIFVGLLKEDA